MQEDDRQTEKRPRGGEVFKSEGSERLVADI